MSHFRDNTLFFQFHNRVNLTWFLLRKHNYPCSGSIQVNKDLSYYNNTKNLFLTMLKVNLKMVRKSLKKNKIQYEKFLKSFMNFWIFLSNTGKYGFSSFDINIIDSHKYSLVNYLHFGVALVLPIWISKI